MAGCCWDMFVVMEQVVVERKIKGVAGSRQEADIGTGMEIGKGADTSGCYIVVGERVKGLRGLPLQQLPLYCERLQIVREKVKGAARATVFE